MPYWKTKPARNRGYGTITIGAPVIINGKPGKMGVVIANTEGGNKYRVHRIVMPDGTTFIINEKTNAALDTSGGAAENSSHAQLQALRSEHSIASAPENVNPEGNLSQSNQPRFSMNAPVERKGELVAVHNLDVEGMRETLKIGGFPMSSVAIVKAMQGHSQYGPLSVVFYASAIDPQTDRRNRIYGGDAWTPTKDNAVIEQKINENALTAVRDKITELDKGLDPHFSQEANRWINELMQYDATRESIEDWENKAWNNLGFLAAFQKAITHSDADVVMREEVNTDGYRMEYAKIYDGLLTLLEREGKLEEFREDVKNTTGKKKTI